MGVRGEEVAETGEESAGTRVVVAVRVTVAMATAVVVLGVVAVVVAVAVGVCVLVPVVPVAHGGPLPVRGSGRTGVHDAIMCV
ncbi:hypothetical protein SGFS_094860 [Streptomyces graminofaciens]|jgi:hypothetical protein|uniref:Uncharacterized protein n=1 Tax=Streptomyces graminofaciens TaxID=68212 RepID=A0ABM7FP75_9ACTN|nr:hypothetical protein SGFS_094860 [Streptomyces graminofaciens]